MNTIIACTLTLQHHTVSLSLAPSPLHASGRAGLLQLLHPAGGALVPSPLPQREPHLLPAAMATTERGPRAVPAQLLL